MATPPGMDGLQEHHGGVEKEMGGDTQALNCLDLDMIHFTFNYSLLAQTGHMAPSNGKGGWEI